MAPWPNRVDSTGHAFTGFPPQQQPQQPSSRPSPGPGRFGTPNSSRLNEFEVLDSSQLQGDSSSSDEGLHPPSRPQRPGHHRSMSHPFPSLFSSSNKKKRQGNGSDSSDDDTQVSKMKNKVQPQRSHRNGSASGSKDFATGNCMTCNSLVRWPRELSVFKCTICLTVNDLVASGSDGKRDGPQRAPPVLDETTGLGHWPHAAPISVEQTLALIKQSLRSYIKAALAEPAEGKELPSSSAVSPMSTPRSPDIHEAGGYFERHTAALPTRPHPSLYVNEALPDGTLRDGVSQPNPLRRSPPMARSYSTSYPERPPPMLLTPNTVSAEPRRHFSSDPKRIFKPLEDYVIASITSFHCLNTSFATHSSGQAAHTRTTADVSRRKAPDYRKEGPHGDHPIVDLDPKLLLLGDFAENGSWWTGGQEDAPPTRSASHRSEEGPSPVNMRSPRIDWAGLDDWYSMVVNAARYWPDIYDEVARPGLPPAQLEAKLQLLEAQILIGQDHAQRTLLKATETLLKRPGRPLMEPRDLRFLLILLANPLLYAGYSPYVGKYKHLPDTGDGPRGSGPASGRHSAIIKRIFGLMSNTPPDCNAHFISWFSRYAESRFVQMKDLASGFLAYRLLRQNEKKHEVRVDLIEGLIPSMSAGRSPASLHAALGPNPGSSKKPKERPKKTIYNDDWQIRAAARFTAFIFAANNSAQITRGAELSIVHPENSSQGSRDRVHARGQVLPTSDFYVTLLDDSDLVADFEAWEHKRGKFSFCQYPFLLSIWAKIQILEYDARRQMQNKARDAFFDSILSRRAIEQYLVLNIRRECLVEDSLKAVSEVIGSGSEDVKKGLRIVFRGEEGVDAGGLRKEWFLLLVREVFNPDHGMFVYDEDSQYCYFNPNSFETSDQFFLVGVVFGLAIYNSTILDVALPPFAFRKLLLAAPPPAGTPLTHPRPNMAYTLEDLAEFRPRLAKGFRQLLEYDGDVESTFCLDFVVDVDKYGLQDQLPLCPGGEKRPVTNANRREYVDLYVRYLLDTVVARQFEPFKRGFFTVCGGNALSLFRPEEIELLVRGSDEALDIDSLRVAAEYDNWGVKDADRTEPVVQWFWETFAGAPPQDQRKLLLFITGSDRIPAMGAASLTIRIVCLGDDSGRYPSARTCFNQLALYRYKTREQLVAHLWTAVRESEGFGLK